MVPTSQTWAMPPMEEAPSAVASPASLVATLVVVSSVAAELLPVLPQAARETAMAAAMVTDRIFFILYSPLVI